MLQVVPLVKLFCSNSTMSFHPNLLYVMYTTTGKVRSRGGYHGVYCLSVPSAPQVIGGTGSNDTTSHDHNPGM